MTVLRPETQERPSHPAQRMLGNCWPITAVKWWLEASGEMPRAGDNIGKKSPESQPKTGSSSAPQSTNRFNRRGAIPAESKPWLGSRKGINGAQWLSLSSEVAYSDQHRRGKR
jgi:hypothetical protein